MGLFDGKPLLAAEFRKSRTGQCLLDPNGRTLRHLPWWKLWGPGPAGKTCGDCAFLVVRQRAKVYFKCGKATITSGPGTDIRKKDEACSYFQEASDVI